MDRENEASDSWKIVRMSSSRGNTAEAYSEDGCIRPNVSQQRRWTLQNTGGM